MVNNKFNSKRSERKYRKQRHNNLQYEPVHLEFADENDFINEDDLVPTQRRSERRYNRDEFQ